MGIVRDLYYARKMSAGLKLPAPTVALLIKRLRLAAAMGGGIEKTVSGTMVHITDALAKAALSVLVNITPIQDLHGYSNPWPAGGGKNLFQTTATSKTESGVTWTVNEDGSITATGTATGATTILAGAASVDASMGNVAISLDGVSAATNIAINYVRLYDANGNQLATIIPGGLSYTQAVFDLSQYADSAEIRVSLKRNNNVATNGTVHIQVEKGTSYTDWAPYSNICPITGRTGVSVYVSPTQDVADATTYAVDWTSPAGTVYGGTLDVVTGVLTVDRKKFIIDGGSILKVNYAYPNKSVFDFASNTSGLTPTADANSTIGAISDTINNITDNVAFTNVTDGFSTGGTGDFRKLAMPSTGITTVAAMNTWLSDNPITVIAPLATPLTYQLTAQEVDLLLGENNLWADGGETLTLTYYADGNANAEDALNLLLGNRYVNNHTPEDVSDREALDILLGR